MQWLRFAEIQNEAGQPTLGLAVQLIGQGSLHDFAIYVLTVQIFEAGPEIVVHRKRGLGTHIHILRPLNTKSPIRLQTGPRTTYCSAPNGLCDLSMPGTARDPFHLIFETVFQLLETMLRHLRV